MTDSLIKVLRTVSCSVCGAENSFLKTRCDSCGAFIQDRVPKLDLFESIYTIFESPVRLFVRVARSEQKNYVYTLFACTGYALTSVIAMMARAGNIPLNFIYIMAVFLLAAPVIGMSLLTFVSLTIWWWNDRIWRIAVDYRTSAALIAYALIPVVLSVFLILPVEFAIFGPILFSDNPSPAFYKPAVFYILTGIDLLALLWSLWLYDRAFSSVFAFARWQNLVTMILALLITGGAMFGIGSLLRYLLNT